MYTSGLYKIEKIILNNKIQNNFQLFTTKLEKILFVIDYKQHYGIKLNMIEICKHCGLNNNNSINNYRTNVQL